MGNQKKNEILAIKRFGYVISTILLILSNIALINEWHSTPFIFIITMYFLTGSLWGSAIIKPFYTLFGKYLVKPTDSSNSKGDRDIFSDN